MRKTVKKQKPGVPGAQWGEWKERIAQTRPQVVCVTWMDACADTGVVLETTPGWREQYSSRGALIETTGFLLENQGEWLVIGQERHAERDSGFRRLVHIPRYAVCGLQILRKEKG
jgi:hypothetical protein